MKRLAIIAVALTAMLAVAAVAVAQYALPVVELTGKVTPSKGGTKKKPKSGQLNVSFTVNKESNSTAKQIVFRLPKNAKVSGVGFPFCTATQINTNGAAACPKGSKVGTGSATAVVGPNQTPFNFTTTIYAASKSSVALLLTGPLTIAITGNLGTAGGNFGQKLTIDIPASVQQPIAGLYGNITGVTASIGKAKVTKGKGKKRKTRFFVSLTGCPTDKTHDMGVTIAFAPNPNPPAQSSASDTTTVACKK